MRSPGAAMGLWEKVVRVMHPWKAFNWKKSSNGGEGPGEMVGSQEGRVFRGKSQMKQKVVL